MRKNFIIFASLFLVIIFTQGQTYHADDKEGLRAFLRQSSAVAGEINAQRLGLQLSDTLDWETQELWVSKVKGLIWNDNAPKRLLKVGPYFDYEWNEKALAGNLNCSKWTELTMLLCCKNQIHNLDVSNNIALKLLNCEDNLLTTLDVKNCVALKDLACESNQLKTLNVNANTQLKSLYFSWNQISTIDISNNGMLWELFCADNQLENLDVQHNTELGRLFCDNNRLTTLDVSKNTKLVHLGCSNNLIETLDLNNITKLLVLDCSYNQLTTLDLSRHGVIEVLYCHNNKLTSFKTQPYPLYFLDSPTTYNNYLLFSEINKVRRDNCLPQNTINGGELQYSSNIDLGTEYIFDEHITQFSWFDITDEDEQTIELTGENGVFYLTKDMIGKRLRCKMTNFAFWNSETFPIIYEITVTDSENISENTTTKITIFPNPTTEELKITNYELGIRDVEIFDVYGKKHESMKARRGEGEIVFNISNLPAGIYFIKINTDTGIQTQKIIKL